LIPFVALGLVIAHQIYVNIPQKDDRPSFIIGGVSEGSVGGLSVVFSVEDEEWRVGDEFVLEFTLTNHDEEYVRRIGLPFFDVRIHDENGIQIFPLERWEALPRNLFLVQVTPGDEFSETKVWDLAVFNPGSGEMEPLGEGRYWLSGVWLGDPVVETGNMPLTIG
jgi:hypothetical protein